MAGLLDIFGFLAVVLRALTLSFSALVIGGVAFRHLILRPNKDEDPPDVRGGYGIVAAAAFALAISQAFYLFASSAVLTSTTGLTLRDLAGASFFVWGSITVVAALAVAARAVRRRLDGPLPIIGSLLILASTVATSHAAARLEHRPLLLFATAAHQAATACWIGGLPFLLLALSATRKIPEAYSLSRRFASLATISVAVLAAGGVVLAVFYVGSGAAVYGTNYGVMLIGKVILFAMAISLGFLNHRIVAELGRGDSTLLLGLRRFGEAEIGIGITAILAAASLTSQPPGIDLTLNRVSWSTITTRMTPKFPEMKTPPVSALSPSSRELWKEQHAASGSGQAFVPGESYRPATSADAAWSEYNHHWAGLVVLIMGTLAMLSRFKGMGWARHWPLAFLGLAAFLFLRADPENWPLGPSGFWESFSSAEVMQHRLFVILILLFAAFEWGVQTGRWKSARAELVFPLICAAGGAMLFAHTHSLTNVKEELLAELSHLPLALLAVMAGWARWLELRLPGRGRALAGRLWPVCFALIGVVLLLYREA